MSIIRNILTVVAVLSLSCSNIFAQTELHSDSLSAAVASDTIPTAHPATEVELNEAADSAYSADNFALAESLYLESIARFGTSATIFYNLGNAYYRQGYLGKAIVNYERALKLDPSNADIKANLEFVKSKITDRQQNGSSVLATLWDNIVMQFQADTWAWISIILFALFIAGALTYLMSSVIVIRKVSFFGGLIIFILCVLSVVVSFSAANRLSSDRFAIILTPSVQLSTTPREARNQAEEAFTLHEGTKVEIVDSISTPADGKWYEVLVGSSDRAWIKAADVEKI